MHLSKTLKSTFFFILSFFLTTTAIANEKSQSWEFELTPYLWAASVDASVVSDTNNTGPINADYDFFLLDHLDAVASGTFVAKKQRLSFLFDGFYAKYADNINRRFTDTDLEMKLGFVEASISYQLIEENDITLIFGVRNIYIDTLVDITPGTNVTLDTSWLDPLIGIQATFPLAEDWSVSLRGDIGGGHDNDLVINSLVNVHYEMTEHTSLKMGYRYMKADLEENVLLENISLNGIQVGLSIQF